MKKRFVFSVILFIFVASFAYSQDKAPSYFEMDDYNRRYPETDTNIDFYIRSWEDSPVYRDSSLHGGWIECPYFTKGDPINPPSPGAILKYIKTYNHGRLDASSRTQKTSHEKEQVFFYITKGEGRIEAGGKTVEISEGSGIFIPARLEYQFFNTSDLSMEAVIVAEDITDDFEPAKEMATGSYHNSLPRAGMHWAHISRSIWQDERPKFQNPIGFGIVSIDTFDMAQPHVAGPGAEEIWNQLKGSSLMLLGNQLRKQEVGMAFSIVPNFKVPHSSINYTNEPIQFLYTSCGYHDRNATIMEFHNPGWKENIYKKYGIEY